MDADRKVIRCLSFLSSIVGGADLDRKVALASPIISMARAIIDSYGSMSFEQKQRVDMLMQNLIYTWLSNKVGDKVG